MSEARAHIEPAPDVHLQAVGVRHSFRERFGREPEWLVAAPGRVNVIGEHTDYNDGFVLPMAIDRFAVLAGGVAQSDAFQVYSLDLEETRSFYADDSSGRKNGNWSNYLRGVVDGCRAAGLSPGPMNMVLQSAVPVGGGLSSSAALEVAMATLCEAATGKRLEGKQKALIAQKAEHEYVGVPCGIMDQFASTLCVKDNLMLLDCRTAEPLMVPLTDTDITLLIIDSRVSHKLAGGEYAERRSQCEEAARCLGVRALRDATEQQLESVRGRIGDVLYRRARHVIRENARTLEAADGIAKGHWHRVGALMAASHESLRDDFEVSCAELDLLVELALSLGETEGVLGSRMTGGGFGGCTVTLARMDAVDHISRVISREYRTQTGVGPLMFVSRPASGAHDLTGDLFSE